MEYLERRLCLLRSGVSKSMNQP